MSIMTAPKNSIFHLGVDDFRQLRVVDLKEILRDHNESITGNKSVLVARCLSVKTKLAIDVPDADTASSDPFTFGTDDKEITYKQLNLSAKARIWSDDLRNMVEFNFNQLHEYLVTRTNKYDDPSMKGSCYKKLKSNQFFMEGHVSNVEVARGQGHTWIKSKVIASMKKTKYNVMVVFHSNGDVRLGMNGHGKCNHIGGVLFAVNSVYANGLHSNTAKVSCTSKLNGWIVPRNLTVPPKPVKRNKN
ncbi:uncharacterized protein LOC110458423 isoform X2 [Mizuhopecten yessoensis]|uniref:uncharacterized protein LOC110458423 isoform X2 n=1 Tax=Mizuhopecten yessoensis TaxID=6573 RepID=UPI000B45999A|nr:uncharacterized protein LOC110458423 isoform X2 [Mizuhopecten yessoensis]